MNKEKEIEGMASDIADICVDLADTSCGDKQCCTCMSKYLIEAGYRKAEEVRKETEKHIYQKLYDLCTKDNPFGAYDLLKEDVLGWAKEDGVEIEECKTVDFEDIEQSDVIELPCKEHFVYEHDNEHITENWRVFYRAGYAFIGTAVFETESEADAFLAELKGGKQ